MTTPTNWYAAYCDFIKRIRIDSKDQGEVPLRLWGSQRHVMKGICDGLDAGVRHFNILKARQQGVSTALLALDLFWAFYHDGLQGTIITDVDATKANFRTILTRYQSSLPRAYRREIVTQNRDRFVFNNGSRVELMVAGKRRGNKRLGQSFGLNYVHGTECASWGSEEGLASLMASLSDRAPNRLYLFESTAQGFNMFYDMCEASKDSTTQRLIFSGWWTKEDYSVERSDPRFVAYGLDPRTDYECEMIEAVRDEYNVIITDEQLAWYRWKLAEQVFDPLMMQQEFPFTADEAFIASGSKFFQGPTIISGLKRAVTVPFKGYKHKPTEDFLSSKLIPVGDPSEAELRIYEEPIPGIRYTIGADPSYGSSENRDEGAINVLACYADRLVQVAEFSKPCIPTYQFSWMALHLAGVYKGALLNLEINGPGQAVAQEMMMIKQLLANKTTELGERNVVDDELADVMRAVRWYLYKRNDTVMGGALAYHWKTQTDTKERMMNVMSDAVARGILEINSVPLLKQMTTIVRQDDGGIGGSGREHDDRVMSMALACVAWNDHIRKQLIQGGHTYQRVHERIAEASKQDPMMVSIVKDFMSKQKERRNAEAVIREHGEAYAQRWGYTR